MTRRDALKIVLTVCGGTVFGAHRMLADAISASAASLAWTAADLTLLDQISETIIPQTADSGGAHAAKVSDFMQEIVRDFYSDAERSTFEKGLAEFGSLIRTKFSGRIFSELNSAERAGALVDLERSSPVPEYYQMIKQLTVWGYFTSEIGATKALAHVSVPGRFEGCVAVGPETRAWSE